MNVNNYKETSFFFMSVNEDHSSSRLFYNE